MKQHMFILSLFVLSAHCSQGLENISDNKSIKDLSNQIMKECKYIVDQTNYAFIVGENFNQGYVSRMFDVWQMCNFPLDTQQIFNKQSSKKKSLLDRLADRYEYILTYLFDFYLENKEIFCQALLRCFEKEQEFFAKNFPCIEKDRTREVPNGKIFYKFCRYLLQDGLSINQDKKRKKFFNYIKKRSLRLQECRKILNDKGLWADDDQKKVLYVGPVIEPNDIATRNSIVLLKDTIVTLQILNPDICYFGKIISHLKQLRNLDIGFCGKLNISLCFYESFFKHKKFDEQKIKLSDLSKLKRLKILFSCSNRKRKVYNLFNNIFIIDTETLPNLKELHVDNMRNFPKIELPKLEKLFLHFEPEIKNSELQNYQMTNLKKLEITTDWCNDEKPKLPNCPKLTSIVLHKLID